ncbi:MAG: pilin [Bacillota bacterium]
MSRRIISFFIILATFFAGFLLIPEAFAQGIDVGTNEISGAVGLSPTDPRIIAARVINFILLFLGVIAVCLVIYAGFTWMMSGGNEDKVDKAKTILRNAVIGLVIILSAWGIATFVLNRLMNATGLGGIFGDNNQDVRTLGGAGAIGACTVQQVYPEEGQKGVARNASIIVSFKEAIKLDTFCQDAAGQACACGGACNRINPVNIRIFRNDIGDQCGSSSCPEENSNVMATVNVSTDRKDFVIVPEGLLGQAEGEVDYSVNLTSGLKKDDGTSVFKTCRNDFLQWSFRVSNLVDLTPPQVVRGGIFPLPDNERDLIGQTQAAVAAKGAVQIQSCPSIYEPSKVNSVTSESGGVQGSAVIDQQYHGTFSDFRVVSSSDNTQAQLFSGQQMLGSTAWSGDSAHFQGFFSLEAQGHQAGNSWLVDVSPEILADNLRVGSEVYTFAATSTGSNILVLPGCNLGDVATAVYGKLSGQPEILVDKIGNKVEITAKVAGQNGNNIILESRNGGSIALTPMSGGLDLVRSSEKRGESDRPMNSVVQLSFNEPVNPIMLSGNADEVASYIRVVNAATSSGNGLACQADSDCRSYACSAGICQGDFIPGRFMVSNAYKTVEFISNRECGLNGCGEKIYCLPANSHLSVELVSANVRSCSDNFDCLQYRPFTLCGSDVSGRKVCQDPSGKNFPTADPLALDGIVDAAMNSLDGNRDVYADGPIAFYDENNSANTGLKDKYRWSFFVSDQLMTEPPKINSVVPSNGSADIALKDLIEIRFDRLMMNSTLKTGVTKINDGQQDVEHHLLGLWSSAPSPFGYWVEAENRDVLPLDGEPDITFAFLRHTALSSSLSYKAQAGSGLKDIYQNCYKPSSGDGCEASPESPSCCFGTPTQNLGGDGNCQ